MFEDRSKYDFNKLDKEARTKVMVEEAEKANLSPAHKKLFGNNEKPKEEIKQTIKNDIIKHHQNAEPLSELPSSAYLKTFENQIATPVSDEEQIIEENTEKEQETSIDFNSLVSQDSLTIKAPSQEKINANKEAPKPKKNFSFRIKLVTGVYCIIVALFGGWVISNSINISNMNSNLYETTTQTTQINNNINGILSAINSYNNGLDPKNETIVVKVGNKILNVTPEEIIDPNQYTKTSNWFDVVADWVTGIFGG